MSRAELRESRRILIDTAAYFALADTGESRHAEADALRLRLVAERWRLFTTNFIAAETHALLLIRLGYRFALRFLDQLDQSPTSLVRVTLADEGRAREIIRRYDDKRFSFTDATSFAVLERLRIGFAFTFDRNFRSIWLYRPVLGRSVSPFPGWCSDPLSVPRLTGRPTPVSVPCLPAPPDGSPRQKRRVG